LIPTYQSKQSLTSIFTKYYTSYWSHRLL